MKLSLLFTILVFSSIFASYGSAQDTGYELVWSYPTDGWVRSAAISRNGDYVAAGSEDTGIYFLNRDGKRLWRYKTAGHINSVSISADGSYVGAASGDSNVYFLDGNGTALWSKDVGAKALSLVSIAGDGSFIAVASEYPDDKVFFFRRKGD